MPSFIERVFALILLLNASMYLFVENYKKSILQFTGLSEKNAAPIFVLYFVSIIIYIVQRYLPKK